MQYLQSEFEQTIHTDKGSVDTSILLYRLDMYLCIYVMGKIIKAYEKM